MRLLSQKLIVYFRVFLVSIICISVSACSNQKPAPHIDKSHLVFSKGGQKHVDENISPSTFKTTEPTVFESAPYPESEIVQAPLKAIPDTQEEVLTKTTAFPETKTSSYDVNKLTDIDLEKEVDSKSTELANKKSEPIVATEGPTAGSAATGSAYKIKSPLNSVKFDWPVEGKVLSHYGKQGNKFNEGINISAPLGAPVTAASDGKVVYIGNNVEGYGNLVILRHDSDLMTAYAHLKEIVVERGAVVKRGESLGSVGQVGNVTQPQLHFSIRKGKKTINPELPLN